jgi:uroporphyrinogen decarboxylase
MTTWLLGFEKFYISLITDIDLVNYIVDIQLDLKIAYWDKVLPVVGEYADVVVEADDLGAQNRLLFSPDIYRKHFKHRHKKLFDFIHRHTKAKIFLHCCGAIRPLIPDLIEVGVDILNPIQVGASGMDTAGLKKDFGNELVFWGAAVDPQNVLSGSDPQAVKNDVKRRIDDLAPNGGFVFAPVHNIQANVPAENIIAMQQAFQEFCIY